MGRDRELRKRERLCLLEGSREDRRRYFSMLKRVGEVSQEQLAAYVLYLYESESLSESTVQWARTFGYLPVPVREGDPSTAQFQPIDLVGLYYDFTVQEAEQAGFSTLYFEFLIVKELMPLWDEMVFRARSANDEEFHGRRQHDDPHKKADSRRQGQEEGLLYWKSEPALQLMGEIYSQLPLDQDDEWHDCVIDLEYSNPPQALLTALQNDWDCPCQSHRRKLEREVHQAEKWYQEWRRMGGVTWELDDGSVIWLELFLSFLSAAYSVIPSTRHDYSEDIDVVDVMFGLLNHLSFQERDQSRRLLQDKIRRALIVRVLKLEGHLGAATPDVLPFNSAPDPQAHRAS